MASSTVMPTLWNVPSLMALVKEYRETLVALLATMIRAFKRPMKAMNSPMPTEMACFSVMGMALKMASRMEVRDRMTKMMPSINTAERAISQLFPICRHTV